jgi:hypothetical protein
MVIEDNLNRRRPNNEEIYICEEMIIIIWFKFSDPKLKDEEPLFLGAPETYSVVF